MIRGFEARLAKIEMASGGTRRAHEDWLEYLGDKPLSADETQAQDEQAVALAVAEHGSLRSAAVARREQATRLRDPLEDLYAGYLESLCEQKEVEDAFA